MLMCRDQIFFSLGQGDEKEEEEEEEGGEKEVALSSCLSGFDVTKDGRAQLKGHYCKVNQRLAAMPLPNK